jgi:exopolyphosphatase/guanosine-5'-triphosphate,3'-diphosphate pyrophosphatase
MGGTVRNLARIDQKRRRYPLERLHGYVMTRESIERTIALLRKKDAIARGNVPGLNRDRADVILAGAVILHQVLEQGKFEQITISGQGLREGLFYAHFLQHQERPLIDNVRSFGVHNLAILSHYEPTHSHQVCNIALMLFDQLQPLHGYGPWERELLGYAAILHDIGIDVGYYDHHKHSAYLLLNTGLPGFKHRELALLTILVRSHRKGEVKVDEYRMVLEEGDDDRAQKLGALLRLSEFLERSKSQVIKDITVSFAPEKVFVRLCAEGDAVAEMHSAMRRSGLFKKAFERDIEFSAEPI